MQISSAIACLFDGGGLDLLVTGTNGQIFAASYISLCNYEFAKNKYIYLHIIRVPTVGCILV